MVVVVGDGQSDEADHRCLYISTCTISTCTITTSTVATIDIDIPMLKTKRFLFVKLFKCFLRIKILIEKTFGEEIIAL